MSSGGAIGGGTPDSGATGGEGLGTDAGGTPDGAAGESLGGNGGTGSFDAGIDFSEAGGHEGTGNATSGGSSGGGAFGAGGGGGSSGGNLGGAGGATAGRKAFMVGLPTAIPTAGDNVMAARLKAHGFQVTFVSDKTVTAQTVAGADVVVISSSAESGNLGVRLKDIPIPIFCIENGQFPNQGMTPAGKGVGEDSVFGQTAVAIIAPTSLLSGGLTGNVTISSKPGELGWGAPPPTAMNVATVVGQANRSAVFGYAKGDQMVGMTAPARRAGFAIREDLAANLSANGIKLFDSILTWVAQ